ncbi:Tat (twin-arginine translocation) pathway signal sequence [Actinosynnema pretiosum]|nr:twin-arginine translocation signal domain-containing protein [Actinosynnema pretiosum]MCP2093117.1 Tat (twin-arginine translocation) pathway signal sequence [Actinosynnema pretiosum]
MTRRGLLRATGAAGAALLLGRPAEAESRAGSTWLDWLADNRERVAAVVDPGAGPALVHRPHAPQPLAAAITPLHLAAHELSGATGTVPAADWDRHHLGQDGGAHASALADLGITATDGTHADDPHHPVDLDDLASALVRRGDDAAADLLLHRLGEPALRAAAVRLGWPDAPVASALDHRVRLVLDRDAPDYLTDPGVRLEVLGRLPQAPTGYEGLRPWARTTWRGAADGLSRAHRALATDPALPRCRAWLGAGREAPEGVLGVGLAGGALPGVLAAGGHARFADGRVGVVAVLLAEVPQERHAAAREFEDLVLGALLDGALLADLRAALA